jgi:hypothetical protein
VPCVICTWHMETRSASFLVEPQNQGRRFVSGLASKPLGQFSLGWPQNQWRWFSPVLPQNWWCWFLPVWPQIRWWVSWLRLKIKVVEGFPVWASKLASLVRFYFPWPDLVFTAAVFPVILSFPARAMVLLVSSPAQQLFCTGFWAAAILSVWLFPDSPD